MGMLGGRRGHAIAIAVLFLVPLAFFWDMVVRGHEPIAPDTQAVRPLGVWARQAQEGLGEMPLWCPGVFSGMPSYGSFVYTPSGPLDLVRDLRLLCGGNRGLEYFVSLMIGALAIYALLVLRRKHPLCALSGSVIYTMTPYMLGLIAAGHSTKLHALYLAPVVFLAVELLLRKRALVATGFLAVALALQLWSNHPQITYYTMLLSALYVLGVLLWDRPESWRGRGLAVGLLLGFVGVALAAGLAMEPYAAVMEYTPYSIRGAPSALSQTPNAGAGVGWDYATAWSFPPGELISFLFPAWFGLEGGTYWGMLPFTQSTHYFGASVLLLAVLGLLLSSGRRRWIWLALSCVILLIGFGRHLPVLYRPMYELLPMFNRFRVPSMIYALLPLLAAFLAAEAMSAILADGIWSSARSPKGKKAQDSRQPGKGGKGSGDEQGRRRSIARDAAKRDGTKESARDGTKASARIGTKESARARAKESAPGPKPDSPGPGWIRRRWGGVTLAFLLLLILWLVAGSWVTDRMRCGGAFMSARESSQIGPHITSVLQGGSVDQLQRAGVPDELVRLMTRRMSFLHSTVALSLLFLTLMAVVIEGRRRGLLKGEAAAALIFLIIVADLWVIDRKFYNPVPRQQSEVILQEDEVVRFLKSQEGPFRIAPLTKEGFGSNRYAAFGIESVGGYQPAKLRIYDDLIQSGALTTLPVLSMLNVRFILTDQNMEASGLLLASAARSLSGKTVYIHENPLVMPRAWFVRELRNWPDAKILLSQMRAPEFDPARTAYVYHEEMTELPDSLSSGEVLSFEVGTHHQQAQVRVTGPGPGLLVMSEIAYPPGWIATVNGEETPLLRVNHVLRAIKLPPGEHLIEVRAVSRARRAGVLASRFSALLVLLLIAAGCVGKRLKAHTLMGRNQPTD
ncbi:MAG: hypothetical protein KAY24_15095 [Candidatus Eisenbacteria sp.]|nr:hypothetical protein [Candidatus Eisenbacteria bacterium]